MLKRFCVVGQAAIMLQPFSTSTPYATGLMAIYEGEVLAALVTPGLLNYRIVIQKDTAYTVFRGNHKGNPFAWDNYINDTWQAMVVSPTTGLNIFNAADDKRIKTYPPFRRNFKTEYITSDQSGDLVLHLSATTLANEPLLGFVHYMGDQFKGRGSELSSFNYLVIRARTK